MSSSMEERTIPISFKMAANGLCGAWELRRKQVIEWEKSEANRESDNPKLASRVAFQNGCVFLAACSQGDLEEVQRLLESGADINTVNVDGLTALHQACIDGNMDVVKFLVEKGADVNKCDNEGWTALHILASCGFKEIARYLLEHGANLGMVNNDRDLVIDIASDTEMVELLREEMDKRGIEEEDARKEEEEVMLADAKRWLQNNKVEDRVHPKTGATSLHVAAAKGYIKVMNVLLEAGVDINARDKDGWTPLHAAVHWGQKEACQVLVDHLCDMDLRTYAGYTVSDLADEDMEDFVEELKKKQVTLRKSDNNSNDIIQTAEAGSRRSTMKRMSSEEQKQSVEERTSLGAKLSRLSDSYKNEEQETSRPASIAPSTDSTETERQNELNRQSSLANTESTTKVHENSKAIEDSSLTSEQLPYSWRRRLMKTSSSSTVHDKMSSAGEKGIGNNEGDASSSSLSVLRSASSSRIPLDSSKTESLQDRLDTQHPHSGPGPLSPATTSSAAASTASTTSIGSTTSTGSTDMRLTDRYSWSVQSNYAPYRDYLSRSGYKPFYQRQQEINQQNEEKRAQSVRESTHPSSSSSSSSSSSQSPSFTPTSTPGPVISSGSSSAVSSPTITISTVTATTTTSAITTTTATTSLLSPASAVFRSYEPPKRDEETEAQRKAKAKQARQTRRPTQGITKEDFQQAQAIASKGDSDKNQSTSETTFSTTTAASLRDSSQGITTASITSAGTTTLTTTTTTTVPSSSTLLSSHGTSSLAYSGSFRERPSNFSLSDSFKERTSNLSLSRSFREPSSSFSQSNSFRRRHLENQQNEDSTTRTSFRIPRDDKESSSNGLSASSDLTSSYVPRSQRNVLSAMATPEIGSTSPSLSRSVVRGGRRLQNQEAESVPTDDHSRKKEETQEPSKTEATSEEPVVEKKESAAARRKKMRIERRPTQPLGQGLSEVIKKYREQGQADEDESDDSSEESEESKNASRIGRYSSSDVPAESSSRGRLSEYSRSTTSLDDYKKLYEEEKEENGKLRKELERVKRDLLEAKEDLDKLMKNGDPSRHAESVDKREKRALERKVSEYEEELKKLRDEKNALIRVISKLSK